MASKCISKLTRSRLSTVSPDSLDYGLHDGMIMASKCVSKIAPSWSRSASPSSLHYVLQVYLKLARLEPGSVSLSSLDRHFQVRLKLLPITAYRQSRYTVCRWVAILIHRWEYTLNTWVLTVVEREVVAMMSRRTSSVAKEDVVCPRLLYCDSRCSQTCCWRSEVCCWRSQVLPGLSQVLPVTPKAGMNALQGSDTPL